MSPALKFYYLDFPGRGELSRLVFTFGGVPFEDVRVDGPQFYANRHTYPFGQLPTLEVDGVVLSQSNAIARYAARLAGLYPTDVTEMLRVDMICETCVDMFNHVLDITFITTDEAVKAEKAATFLNEILPQWLPVLERIVRGKFFMGDNATLADLHLFDIVVNGLKAKFPKYELDSSKYPKLEGVIEAVKSNANVVAHLTKAQIVAVPV
ncbi:Hematopoietic prostaglandin d synthase, partial [Globisporangium splendens]